MLIEGQNISVAKEAGRILDNVSLQIDEKDFLTIVGPNGAGKTMLLKCLLGVLSPDEGTVTHKPGLTIGYMPQSMEIDPVLPLSVKRFLTLNMTVETGFLDEIILETDIGHLVDRQMHALSGGEIQRVMLARALARDPDLLILDEPAQNLDISGQLEFYKLLERIYHDRQKAILMVSHDIHLVMASTQRVICLYHHVCCSGAPQAITQDPEFISIFGDDLSKMMAVYPHEHDHDHSHSLSHSLSGHDHHGGDDHS